MISNIMKNQNKTTISMSRDVTVCAVDCSVPELAARAINKTNQQCRFANSILFSNKSLIGDFSSILINDIKSLEEYNLFILNELVKYIKTKYVLIIQWDGYVVNGDIWDNAFFNYDYIGAIWPQHLDGSRVGNGGFSLRSSRLMNAVSRRDFCRSDENEDEAICRINRSLLENKYRIRFSGEVVANIFSYEQTETLRPTFGFHGLWNIPNHETDQTMRGILQQLPASQFKGYAIQKLLMRYFFNGNRAMCFEIYLHILNHIDEVILSKSLIMALGYNQEHVNTMMSQNKIKNRLRPLIKLFGINNSI
jgi:hypothetical protein